MHTLVSQLEVVFEEKREDGQPSRFYKPRLLLDHDTPIGIAKEAIFQLQKMIGQIEDNLKAQSEQAEVEEKPVESIQEPPKVEAIS